MEEFGTDLHTLFSEDVGNFYLNGVLVYPDPPDDLDRGSVRDDETGFRDDGVRCSGPNDPHRDTTDETELCVTGEDGGVIHCGNSVVDLMLNVKGFSRITSNLLNP